MAKRGTLEHPKTLALADCLNCDESDALGMLESLWLLTAKFYHTGKLGLTAKSIGRAIRTRRDSESVWNALVECGWIDIGVNGQGYVHDWFEHADDTVKKNLRKRVECFELPDGTTLEPYAKRESNNTEEVANDSRTIREQCANHLRQPEPEPEPEPINTTILGVEVGGMGEGASPAPLAKPKSGIVRFEKPSLERCKAFASEIGLSDNEAEKYWNYYESNGWKAGKNPMRDWQAAMRGWQKRAEEYAPTKNGKQNMQGVYQQAMATLEEMSQ